MYTDRIAKIYLNKAKLNFYWGNGSPLKYESLIGSICRFTDIEDKPIINLPNGLKPDYSLGGIIIKDSPSKNPSFILGEGEPNTLYITGLLKTSDLSKFRIPGTIWSSYWEEQNSDLGYLFQII